MEEKKEERFTPIAKKEKKKNFEYAMESTHSVAVARPQLHQRTVVSRPTNVKLSKLRAKNKRKSPLPLLIGIVLGIIALVVFGVLFINKKNETKAKGRYQDALQYVTSMKNETPPNYAKAIVEIEYALADTKGSIYEEKLNTEYAALKKLQADAIERMTQFDRAFDAFNKKVSDLDKELKEAKSAPDTLDGLLVKYQALPDILKKIKKVEDPSRNSSLKTAAKNIKNKVTSIKGKIAKRNQVRREKARILAEEKRRAEMAARAKKKEIAAFKETVVHTMNETRIRFVLKGKKGALPSLDIPLAKGLAKGSLKDDDVADILGEYNTWSETFKAIQFKANHAWNSIANSGKKFARTRLLLGYTFYEIASIKEGVIKFKEKPGSKVSEIKVNNLTFKQFSQLLKERGKRKRFAKDGTLGCYALAIGEFIKANNYRKDSEPNEFHNIMLCYLEYTLLKLSKTIDSEESEKAFKKLTKKYNTIPEFKEAIEYVNKRTGQEILKFKPPKKKKKRR